MLGGRARGDKDIEYPLTAARSIFLSAPNHRLLCLILLILCICKFIVILQLIIFISLYASHYKHLVIWICFNALGLMQSIYTSHSLYFNLEILFFASHSKHLILCFWRNLSHSMHLNPSFCTSLYIHFVQF